MPLLNAAVRGLNSSLVPPCRAGGTGGATLYRAYKALSLVRQHVALWGYEVVVVPQPQQQRHRPGRSPGSRVQEQEQQQEEKEEAVTLYVVRCQHSRLQRRGKGQRAPSPARGH